MSSRITLWKSDQKLKDQQLNKFKTTRNSRVFNRQCEPYGESQGMCVGSRGRINTNDVTNFLVRAVTWGAIHSTKISGNFGPKLNGSVRSNRKSFEKTGPPFEVDHGRDPFNQNSDRSDREKRTTSKGGPVFSKLFRLDRTDPLSFGPKFPEILVEWIAPHFSRSDRLEFWLNGSRPWPV